MERRISLTILVAAFLLVSLSLVLNGPILSAADAGKGTGAAEYALSTADGLALTLSDEGEVLRLTMNGDALSVIPAPVLWIRDMSEAGQVITPNLLTNAGFEDGLNGWSISQEIATTITITTAVHRSGSQALQMFGSNSEHLGTAALAITFAIPVTAGLRYRLSGYFLSSRGYVQGVSGTPPVRQDKMWWGQLRPNGLYVLRWLDAHGSQVGTLTLAAPLHWNANSWRRITGEVRAPTAATQMEVIIGGRLQDEMLWVDDLSMVASPETDVAVRDSVGLCEGETRVEKEEESVSCLCQTATLPQSGLMLTVTYTAAADHIGVQVEVGDFDSSISLAGYVGSERGSYINPEGAQQVLANDSAGIFTAEYIIADAPLNIAPVSEPRLTYSQTISRMLELAFGIDCSDTSMEAS